VAICQLLLNAATRVVFSTFSTWNRGVTAFFNLFSPVSATHESLAASVVGQLDGLSRLECAAWQLVQHCCVRPEYLLTTSPRHGVGLTRSVGGGCPARISSGFADE